MNRLTDTQVASFERDGFLSPLRAISADEAATLRAKLETVEAERGSLTGKLRSLKSHLLMTWLDGIVRRAAILDPIESLLGPDILCWSTSILIKEPGDGTHVTWHQDLNYWGLAPGDVVTAWLALSPATEETGCMRMIPGSHLWTGVTHRDTDDDKNLLSRGQVIERGIDETRARHLALRPGEFSLHHGNTAHDSAPNRGAERRIGIAIRYMAAHVRPVNGADSALLVRGNDGHRHFEAEKSPVANFDAAARAEHDRAMNLRHAVMLDTS